MNQNVDLDRWKAIWRTGLEGRATASLQDGIARETRRRKAALVGPVAVTVMIGGWVVVRAWTSATVLDIAMAVEAWLFIAVTWATAIWIKRRTWQQLGMSTTSFLEASIHRCRGEIAGIGAGVVLYVVQVAAMLVVKQYFSPSSAREILTEWPVIFVGWIGVPVLSIAAVRYGRRKRKELERLLDVRMQLREG